MKLKRKYVVRRLVLLFLVLGIFVFAINQVFFKNDKIEVVSQIDDYPYYLENNATKIYKKYFRELEKELEDLKVDEENYVSLVSQLFIIDFYTLSNKVTNQDVGGVQFIHSSIQDNFSLKATDTIYKYVESNIYGNRSQKLPTVKDVKVSSVKNISYQYNDSIDEFAYQVEVSISYKRDLGYDKSKTIILVHEDNVLSIVEVK